MNHNLFRKDVLDRISAPEQLNDYIKVVKPSVWLILLGIVLAAGGTIAFLLTTNVPLIQLFLG